MPKYRIWIQDDNKRSYVQIPGDPLYESLEGAIQRTKLELDIRFLGKWEPESPEDPMCYRFAVKDWQSSLLLAYVDTVYSDKEACVNKIKGLEVRLSQLLGDLAALRRELEGEL